MNIAKYAAFFHDGSVFDMQHTGNKIELSMASVELDKEEIKDNIILSKDDSIQGKLHIEGVASIIIDGKKHANKIKKRYDRGRIFDFEITNHSMEISIDWVNFPPKSEVNEFSVIKIEAEKIWWENIPDLEDYT